MSSRQREVWVLRGKARETDTVNMRLLYLSIKSVNRNYRTTELGVPSEGLTGRSATAMKTVLPLGFGGGL